MRNDSSNFISEMTIETTHWTKNEVLHYGFLSKCDQIRRKLRIWSHLLKKFLMENFTFFAVVETGTELKTGRNKESLANK